MADNPFFLQHFQILEGGKGKEKKEKQLPQTQIQPGLNLNFLLLCTYRNSWVNQVWRIFHFRFQFASARIENIKEAFHKEIIYEKIVPWPEICKSL